MSLTLDGMSYKVYIKEFPLTNGQYVNLQEYGLNTAPGGARDTRLPFDYNVPVVIPRPEGTGLRIMKELDNIHKRNAQQR